MKIKIIDGESIEKDSIKEILKHMKKQDASIPKNIKEYMETVKSRFEKINIKITTNSCKDFLYDLEEIGFLKIIEEKGAVCIE